MPTFTKQQLINSVVLSIVGFYVVEYIVKPQLNK